MTAIHYFAYGSNMHPIRLQNRISTCRYLGVARLKNYRLAFHKRGTDGSGKCNIIFTGSHSDYVCGVLYQMQPRDRLRLDRYEGVGYKRMPFYVNFNGKSIRCFAYTAIWESIDLRSIAYHWYKSLVQLGAIQADMPKAILDKLQNHPSIQDPDRHRRHIHNKLVHQIRIRTPKSYLIKNP